MKRKWLLGGFIGFFIVALCFPFTRVFNEKGTREAIAKENRYPNPAPTAKPWEKEFYTQFEAWFQDRLNGRESLLRRWRLIYYYLGINLSKNIVFSEDWQWMFARNRYVKKFLFKDEKLRDIKRVQEYCHKHNVQFIFTVPPSKESVYRELIPVSELEKGKDWLTIEKEIIEASQKYTVAYLPLGERIMHGKESGNLMHFQDDSHWSYYGGEIGADTILKYLLGDEYSRVDFDLTKNNVYKETSYANEFAAGYIKTTDIPWSSSFTDYIQVEDCRSRKITKYNKVIANDYL